MNKKNIIKRIKKYLPPSLVIRLEYFRSRALFNPLRKNNGYCACCRKNVVFYIYDNWLRDHYLCSKCKSKPRQRVIQFVLDKLYQGWERKKIHESSPSNKYISQYCSDYTFSQLLTGVENGQYLNGVRCENLESMTFSDDTFDIFITQEVLEHVFHPDKALREIMRVLKPGGIHIFTAPKHKKITYSYPRAILEGGLVKNLYPEEFHGNPVGDGKALVTWDYGADFEELIKKWTGCEVTTYSKPDTSFGLDGEFLDVFIVTKPS